MKIEAKSKIIGDCTYKVTPFLAIEAIKLKTRLIKLLAPAIGRMLGGLENINKNDILDSKLNGEMIGSALEHLFSNLGEDEYIALLKRLLANTIAEVKTSGAAPKNYVFGSGDEAFNIVFSGRTLDLYKVIFFILEVNYPDFFALMGDFGSRARIMLLGVQKGEENS